MLSDLRTGLTQTVRGLTNKSGLGGAIHYALKLCPTLTRYIDDGRIEIDSNAAEWDRELWTWDR